MKTPRDLHGADIAKALRRMGFVLERQQSSHLIFRKDGKTAVVPWHRPVKVGTLNGILKQAGVELDELMKISEPLF